MPGTCLLDFNQAGSANYNAAPQVQQSISVGKGAQTIIFTPPTTGRSGVAPPCRPPAAARATR